MAKKTRRGQKQCPKCNAWVKGTRAKECPKCSYLFNGQQPALKAAPALAEKPTKAGDTITLEQIRKVAQTVKTIGGFGCLNELLGLIREVGGVRKFKDLGDAMSVIEMAESKA